MNQAQTIHDEMGDRIYLRIYALVSKRGAGWPSVGAVSGLLGGLLTVPVALLLSGMSKFIAPVEIVGTLDVLSNILFLLTLPLLALAACCLDLLENKFPATPPAEYQTIGLEGLRHLRPRHLHNN
jgi:hypothetical protein